LSSYCDGLASHRDFLSSFCAELASYRDALTPAWKERFFEAIVLIVQGSWKMATKSFFCFFLTFFICLKKLNLAMFFC
jgi:hypothetical protein